MKLLYTCLRWTFFLVILGQNPATSFDSFCPSFRGGFPTGFSCSLGENIHKEITLGALSLNSPDCAVSGIADEAGRVDFNEYSLVPPFKPIPGSYDPRHHFDRVPGQTHRQAFLLGAAYVQTLISQARAKFAQNQSDQAMVWIGFALHALQDLFSHSNFVDPIHQLPDSERPIAIAALFDRTIQPPPDLWITYYDPALPHADDSADPLTFSHEEHAKDDGGRPGFSDAKHFAEMYSTVLISAAMMGFSGSLCSDPGGKLITPISSLDPNGKVGSAGSGTMQYTSGQQPLRYAISFENTATASAPAQTVIVTDQLDVTTMDLSNLSLGPILFSRTQLIPAPSVSNYTTTVDLRPSTNLLVRIDANLNKTTGLLVWHFASLDPATGLPPTDPLAGFLPPGVGGSVLFTVMGKQTLATGTQIRNAANIVFDLNSPITTSAWVNTLDNTPPTSKVAPLSATGTSFSFAVQWSGSDIGAGIQDFTVYVSDNGGPFTPWLIQTTATQAIYSGVGGHTYGFYSIARDLTGNIENGKISAEASTRILVDTTPPVIVPQISGTLGNNGWYRSNVTVSWSVTDPESGLPLPQGAAQPL